VESLAVYQFVLPATCLEYDYTFSLDANGVYPCKPYDDPDYQYPYFENGTVTYSKLTPEFLGQTLNFTLATPIAAQKSGGLLVSFRTKNFTRQRLGGLFSYSVTSLAVPDPITDFTLGIDVDTDDLILKGGTGRVDYNDLIYAAVDSPEQDIRANASGLDEALQIVGSGQLTKSASSLDAGETFTVQGSYGTSWLGLNLLPILLVVFVLLCLVGLTIWTTLRRKQLLAARSEHSLTFQSWWFEFWMSLLVASLAVGFTYLVSWLLGGLIYLNLNNGVATILIVVVTALIYCFLLLGFPLFVGLKRGWLRIFGSVLFEILWLVVIVVLLLYFTGSFENFMPIELS
ncbi:hypothetical protein HY523_00625, partial [Candidatus Berkelbacteria bacterium]|nr:hypothetical protein [Candidatus Berkelbacteria bacterium]